MGKFLVLNRQFNVLIVEDETDIFEYIESVFTSLGRNISITRASSRDEAIELLNNETNFFDYISLDLTMPAETGSFEKDPANGLAVLGTIVKTSSGTPVLILTATSTIEMIQEFLQFSHNVDIWGGGNYRATIEHLTKARIYELKDKLIDVYSEFSSIMAVEILSDGLELPIEHDRLIRFFVNHLKGCVAEVKAIGGGLSSAKVYSLNILDSSGNLIYRAICKCGPKKDIDEDAANYQTYINRLKPDATPRILGHHKFSAKSNSGVCYGLAENYNNSFFNVSSSDLIDELQNSITDMLAPWHSLKLQSRKSIKDIRRMLVKDDVAEELIKKYNLEDTAFTFEAELVYCKISCIHKDFHGENILLDVASSKATLIDYGDVSEGVCILDPLTLECSFLFHPSSKISTDWPTEENLSNWIDLDKFLDGCPIPEKIRFCRNWTNELGLGNRELAACLYSYALRQLKYPNTNKEIALKLINIAFSIYDIS